MTFCHLAWHLVLIFLAYLMLDILLYPSQHERLENSMQTLNFNLVEFFLILTVGLNVLRKPLIEELMRVKKVRHDKVEKSPQFGHVVLDGGSCQQQPVS